MATASSELSESLFPPRGQNCIPCLLCSMSVEPDESKRTKRRKMKTISIVIPVFNESKRIHTTFEALKKFSIPRGLKLQEIIFVNDGSTDNTQNLIKKFILIEKIPSSIISYKNNLGKGYAVKQGMLKSSSDYTLLCDADMSTPLSELSKFLPFIKSGEEIIIGTRKNGKSMVIVHQSKFREIMGKCFTLLTKTILRLQITDFTCGFKLFSKKSITKIFPQSKINRWGYDAEILYIAKKEQIKSKECPVVWSDVKDSHVNIFQAVIVTLIDLARIILFHTSWNKKGLQVFSSKDLAKIG